MARRNSKNESALIVLVVIIGVPIWIISKITDSIGAGALALIVLVGLGAVLFYLIRKRTARLSYLRMKYGDETVVQKIMQRRFWQGQTIEQLQDSLGHPASKDNGLLKTRKREVWKYQPSGRNRYRLRITLDDDVVVAWDQKN
jgi:hypothetical protein